MEKHHPGPYVHGGLSKVHRFTEDTRTVHGGDYTGPRPHVQGSAAGLRVRGGGRIADAGGLVVVRRLWDALGLGRWIDGRAREVPGRYRPSLMVELWVVLLLYGGGVMDDLPLLERRGVRCVFG